MRKNLLFLSLGLSAVLGVVLLTPNLNNAKAGFEPSPFLPEINQLYAVSNILYSADYRVAKSIAHPPDPCVPPDPCNSPDLNGAVNRLDAISVQVSSADDMVDSIITEVMGVEPMPFYPFHVDVIPALEVVRDAGQSIDDRITEFILAQPPDPIIPPDYFDALEGVALKASDVVETAELGIGGICPCFADAQWRRIWGEWPAAGVPNQCAERLSTYSFELGHWVFGDDEAREFIAVLEIGSNTACRAQYGYPSSSSHDVPITSAQVYSCADMMRAKAAEAGVNCIIE